MTWAIVRNGEVLDHAKLDTLEELFRWSEGRQPKGSEIVMMDLRVGASVEVGTRVVVSDLRVRLGELAAASAGGR